MTCAPTALPRPARLATLRQPHREDLPFDDFGAAARFVGRMADDAAVAGRQPPIDLRCDCVTVAFAPRDGSTLTLDDLAVAHRIQRLIGDHRHLVGRAGPWSPRGTLAGIRPRPVGQAGP